MTVATVGNDATTSARVAARDLRQRETPAEKVLWAALRDRRFNGVKFRRQHPIGRYVLDFYCSEVSLGIELDGGIHDEQADMDAFRSEYLTACGITVIRFRNEQVLTDLATVLEQIATAFNDLAHSEPSFPSPAHGRGGRGEGKTPLRRPA